MSKNASSLLVDEMSKNPSICINLKIDTSLSEYLPLHKVCFKSVNNFLDILVTN